MKLLSRIFLLIALIVAIPQVAVAQRVDGPGRRNQGGGVNLAPLPGIFTVVSIDSYAQTVRMRAGDGEEADVHVGEDIYDLSKLKAGDKIQVNFLQPDGLSNRLSAANIWPVR